jgi:site-specific DNA-methyltransferase (adenine-specific)
MNFQNQIILSDCRDFLDKIDKESIDLFLSDIPYGINLDDWDVLHNNTNSALLGQSPAQFGKTGFKKRGKPINGWSEVDKNSGKEYQDWCYSWAKQSFPIMKKGANVFIFGARRTLHRAINAMEDAGFLLKDVLAWKKQNAHHRAQKLSPILEKRGLKIEAENWEGWRLGNLAPIYEPIAWFFKPYDYTMTDNILEYGVGGLNLAEIGFSPTNLLEFGFEKGEEKFHEAQKPVKLIEFLIKLTTKENQIVLDPFMGSGTTAVACINTNRNFVGFEINQEYHQICLDRIENLLNKKEENLFIPKEKEIKNTKLKLVTNPIF